MYIYISLWTIISKLLIELNPKLKPENITFMILGTISEKYESYFNIFLAEKNCEFCCFLCNDNALMQDIRAFKNIISHEKSLYFEN